jgi:hypothetical protein
MNYTITEADRKRLTAFIGECFHKPGLAGYCKYAKCHMFIRHGDGNRDFTSPADRQALCEALMREGKWEEFVKFCESHSPRTVKGEMDNQIKLWGLSTVTRRLYAEYMYYLLVEQPERCCFLISKFLEEE